MITKTTDDYSVTWGDERGETGHTETKERAHADSIFESELSPDMEEETPDNDDFSLEQIIALYAKSGNTVYGGVKAFIEQIDEDLEGLSGVYTWLFLKGLFDVCNNLNLKFHISTVKNKLTVWSD